MEIRLLARRFVLLVAVCAVWPAQRVAGDIVIDSFNERSSSAWPITVPTAGLSESIIETGLGGVIGGVRVTTLTAKVLEQGGVDQVLVNVDDTVGQLDYMTSPGADGLVSLVYFGTGVGGVNADLSGDSLIVIDVAGFNLAGGLALPIQVRLDDGPFTASLTRSLTVAGPQLLEFPFAEFAGINTVDLRSIDTVVVSFNPERAADFAIDQINSVVPEPATICLLAVGCLLTARRKHRQS